jgi:hypothetical protein
MVYPICIFEVTGFEGIGMQIQIGLESMLSKQMDQVNNIGRAGGRIRMKRILIIE